MNLIFSFVLALTVFSASNVFAYYTTGESAEVIQPGNYNLGVEPQIRISDGTGVNVNGLLDAPLGKDGSVRATLGFGHTNFYTSLSYKWVPIPDYGKQPAIGGKLEVLYSKAGDFSTTGLKLHPLVSKRFETDYGSIIPYGSLPLGLFTTQANSDTSLQLVGGAEYLPTQLRKWKFSAELGVNLNKAFSYIAGTAIFMLDDSSSSSKK